MERPSQEIAWNTAMVTILAHHRSTTERVSLTGSCTKALTVNVSSGKYVHRRPRIGGPAFAPSLCDPADVAGDRSHDAVRTSASRTRSVFHGVDRSQPDRSRGRRRRCLMVLLLGV